MMRRIFKMISTTSRQIMQMKRIGNPKRNWNQKDHNDAAQYDDNDNGNKHANGNDDDNVSSKAYENDENDELKNVIDKTI